MIALDDDGCVACLLAIHPSIIAHKPDELELLAPSRLASQSPEAWGLSCVIEEVSSAVKRFTASARGGVSKTNLLKAGI